MKSGGFRGYFTIEGCLCVGLDIANPGSDYHLGAQVLLRTGTGPKHDAGSKKKL